MRSNAHQPLFTLHLFWFAALVAVLATLFLTGCRMGPRLIPSSAPGVALANTLAACVNSADQDDSAQTSGNQPRLTAALHRNDIPYSFPCQTLSLTAPSAGFSGSSPTDTATAAINLAHFPTNTIATLP